MHERFRIEAGENNRIVGYAESFNEALDMAHAAHRLSVADGKPDAFHVVHVRETIVQSVCRNGMTVG